MNLQIRNMFDRDIEYIDSWWKRKASQIDMTLNY